MKIFTRIGEMKAFSLLCRKEGKILGFVPTMGYFHEGHLELMRRARKETDYTVVSIFVNPLQFGITEDYLQYPRDFERDRKMAEKENVDVLFSPSVEEMYPEGFQTKVIVEEMEKPACGFYRRGHFQGVATVVLKLFNIVQPHYAYFGLKDYQQAKLLERMVKDLNLDVEIRTIPTIREEDFLAMSSRNTYLSQEERMRAPALFEALRKALEIYEHGETSAKVLEEAVFQHLKGRDGISVQYVVVADSENLRPLREVKEGAVILAAVYVGKTRLIDNILLPPRL
ncbi:MAG: pantoate--beta-alanine ligase [bacterium JZ-2024 1]